MTLYNNIGRGYSRTRPPDPQIVENLIAAMALPLGTTLMDVGAGHGKYANALAERGYRVIAVEPSEVMRCQAVKHENVVWLAASAEDIPLPSSCADGAFIVLALHHFADRQKAFNEIARVVGMGPVVVFTFEPSRLAQFWLADYFPSLGREIDSSFSQLADVAAEVKALTHRSIRSIPFPLPKDLTDKFAAACWSQPEAYLRPEIQNGISSFALMSVHDVAKGLGRLSDDLKSGKWDETYGKLRQFEYYDIGYRFVVAEPHGGTSNPSPA